MDYTQRVDSGVSRLKTVEEIVKAYGTKRLAADLGVRNTAVNNAVTAGIFPARYYRVVSEFCSQISVDIFSDEYLDLFSFAGLEREKILAARSNGAPS